MLVDAERLRLRVAELAREISRDYAGTARPLLLVGVLKGAMFFLSDLMRLIEIPVEVDFMAVASYGSATDSSGVVRILKDLDAAIDDRDVLIIEDIVDSGLTLQYLLRNLGSRDPRTLEVCALLMKPDRSKIGRRQADRSRETRAFGAGRFGRGAPPRSEILVSSGPQVGPAAPLCRLRDTRPLRDRLRPRLRRAPPQPSLRGRVGGLVSAAGLHGVDGGASSLLDGPSTPGKSEPSWYASRLVAVLEGGAVGRRPTSRAPLLPIVSAGTPTPTIQL